MKKTHADLLLIKRKNHLIIITQITVQIIMDL